MAIIAYYYYYHSSHLFLMRALTLLETVEIQVQITSEVICLVKLSKCLLITGLIS